MSVVVIGAPQSAHLPKRLGIAVALTDMMQCRSWARQA